MFFVHSAAVSQLFKTVDSKVSTKVSVDGKHKKYSVYPRRTFIIKMCKEQPNRKRRDSSGVPDRPSKSSSSNIYSTGDFYGGNNNFGSNSQDFEGDSNRVNEIPLPVIKLLQKYNISLSSFPKDIISALKSNELSPLQLEKIALIGTNSLYGFLCQKVPGLWPRLVGNPRFEFSMLVEVLIGVTTKSLSEIRKRGKSFRKEFDFYLSDISLEIVGDIALVWLLSPVFSSRGSLQNYWLCRNTFWNRELIFGGKECWHFVSSLFSLRWSVSLRLLSVME